MDARPRPRGWLIAERVALTVWVGALLAVGYLAVPVLFQMLDDRALAGALAGEMFRYVNVVGLVCGMLLLAGVLFNDGPRGLRAWRSVAVLVMLAVAATILFFVQPQMAALKAEAAGAVLGPDFGRLHGLSSGLYLLASVLGVALVVAGPQRRGR